MIAYDYPLLGAFWTMFWFFMWVLWIMLLFRVFGDIFRSDDMSGWGKAAWSIFVIVVPFFGVFVYLIARGRAMGQRDLEQAQARQQAFNSYVQEVAATGGSADELTKLADLKDRGVINAAEFEQQKAKILA
jgi:type VI protein secretion system component VasK